MRLSKLVWIITLFAIMLCVTGNIKAQAEKLWQHHLWCDCNTGYGCSKPIMAVTDSGYVYTAHMWTDDVAIHKFDPIGRLVWERLCGSGGTSATRPFAIVTDQAGAVYVSSSFDPDWALGEPKDQEFVTVKYTPDGTLAWEGRYTIAGPHSLMTLRDNELSDDGHLYVLGNTGTIWDPWPPDIDNMLYDQRMVLLKYDAITGNLVWAQDSNHGTYAVGTTIDWGSGLVVGQSGDVYTAGNALIERGWCIDPGGADSVRWEQYAVILTRYGSDGALLGTEEFTDDNFDPCNPEPHGWMARVRNMVGDDQGNLYVVALCSASTMGYKQHLFKYNASLNLQWVTGMESVYSSAQTDLMVDRAGDIIFTSNYGTFKFNEAGSQIWTGQSGWTLANDGENNLYVGRPYSKIFDFYDHNEVDPYPEWSVESPGGAIWDMYVDDVGQIYTTNSGGTWCDYVRVGMFAQDHYIRFWDAKDDTLKNAELELYKVHGDAPYFTEDYLGSFETDSLGFFRFPLIPDDKMIFPISMDNLDPDTLSRGDTLKVTWRISDSSTVKHPYLFDNMYTIHQDNLNFDSLGLPNFASDTLKSGQQSLAIGYAEIRYNLVVSVEWDASREYLESLEASFRSMSNYLYDVFDGQVRLDTVLIFDDTAHWDEADVWIYASNMEGPRAPWRGIQYDHYDQTIKLPRKWYGRPDRTRNQTYHAHPLNLDDPYMYRTYAHELGHYAIGFRDEYLYWDIIANKYVNDPLLRCPGIPYYGLMEYQYPAADPYTTEMSNAFHYEDDMCKNTKQYGLNGASCWEQFEAMFEGNYVQNGSDTTFVEIYRPNDTNRDAASMPNDFIYLEGPNNYMYSQGVLDYDVGDRVVFPNSPANPKAGVKEVDVEIRVGGNPKPNVEVWLNEHISPGEQRVFKQGNTADNGHIWILGAENGDVVQSAGFSANIGPTALAATVDESWYSGEVTIGADSRTLDLTLVDGSFPMICYGQLNQTSFDYQLTTVTPFAVPPSLSYRPSTGGAYDYVFGTATDGYDVALTEPSGSGGSITVTAEDNSSEPFFFVNRYTHTEREPSASSLELFGPAGEVQIEFDSGNTTLERAMFLSSPYTIIRTGLTEANIQASSTHSLSIYPSDAMTGNGLLRIHYAEADIVAHGGLPEDEVSLKLFRWIDGSTGWQEVGGTVDTVFNQVVETITGPGVYAIFTTDASVDVDDEHGDILPYRFNLSQNYPNPFNPVTTIEYTLPRRNHVSIEIFNLLGQKVRTLVNREESAGSYTITWDGTTASGQSAATGVYLYRFQAGDHVETKKMLLLK
jgi:hypothetical protein